MHKFATITVDYHLPFMLDQAVQAWRQFGRIKRGLDDLDILFSAEAILCRSIISEPDPEKRVRMTLRSFERITNSIMENNAAVLPHWEAIKAHIERFRQENLSPAPAPAPEAPAASEPSA